MCNECKMCENYSPPKVKWGEEDIKIILYSIERDKCIG